MARRARVVNSLPMSFRNYLPSDFGNQSPYAHRSLRLRPADMDGVGRRHTPKAFGAISSRSTSATPSRSCNSCVAAAILLDCLTSAGKLTPLTGPTLPPGSASVARAYEPEDADGISHFTTDPDRRPVGRMAFQGRWYRAVERWSHPLLTQRASHALVFHANTLVAFMALSAADAVMQRTPMRRCAHCGSWFFIGRSDAQFCSGSCRAASFNADKEITRGKHPKKNRSKRPGDLAKPMARAGDERKRPPADQKLHERKGRKGAHAPRSSRRLSAAASVIRTGNRLSSICAAGSRCSNGAVNTRPRRSPATSATSALPRARSDTSRLKNCRRPISTAPM